MLKLIDELKSKPNIGIVGTFSHFSSAFNEKIDYTENISTKEKCETAVEKERL